MEIVIFRCFKGLLKEMEVAIVLGTSKYVRYTGFMTKYKIWRGNFRGLPSSTKEITPYREGQKHVNPGRTWFFFWSTVFFVVEPLGGPRGSKLSFQSGAFLDREWNGIFFDKFGFWPSLYARTVSHLCARRPPRCAHRAAPRAPTTKITFCSQETKQATKPETAHLFFCPSQTKSGESDAS